MDQKPIEAYWRRFLEETGRDPATPRYDCFHFDNSEEWANGLLDLTLTGKKRATCSSRYFFERAGLPLPRPGNLSVITDWAGKPRCVIQTTQVTQLLFREMTWDICSREGEDDSLESWQQGHQFFFTQDGRQRGYAFSWDMPVVFEDFRVVYPKGNGEL